MADRQSSRTPLGVVMVGSGSDKTKARGERLWLDCADVDLSHGEANLAQLAASRPWIPPLGEMSRYRSRGDVMTSPTRVRVPRASALVNRATRRVGRPVPELDAGFTCEGPAGVPLPRQLTNVSFLPSARSPMVRPA